MLSSLDKTPHAFTSLHKHSTVSGTIIPNIQSLQCYEIFEVIIPSSKG